MKFRRQANQSRGKGTLTIILLLVIFGGVFLAVKTSKVNVEADSLKISGLYGTTLKYEDIQEVALKESLPQNLNRSNGIDFLGGFLGSFKADNMNKLKLFVKSKGGPFIYITAKEGSYVIINSGDKEGTEALYNEIKSKVKSN